jgi:threonine dehydrogenase-like Zn-dependent dehydrogenase
MISLGTELLVSQGLVDKKLESKMSIPSMKGSFELPIKYGYSLIVQDEQGNSFHLMHPHQDLLNAVNKELFSIEESKSEYALISNMETVLNAIWDSTLQESDNVLIIGFGNLGSLLASTLRISKNIEADIYEVNEYRKSRLQELKFNNIELNTQKKYNKIFHTTATSEGLNTAIKMADFEGRIIELSWYGNKISNLKLGEEFHYNRLQLMSSQVSHVSQTVRQTIGYKERKTIAYELLKHESYKQLITEIPFSEGAEFFNQARKGKHPEGLIYVFNYNK